MSDTNVPKEVNGIRVNEVRVSTGSRLHFGLTRVRPDPEPSAMFGGIGVMIDRPSTELHFRTAAKFTTYGSPRLAQFAKKWCDHNRIALPNCEVVLNNAPSCHSGFGSGTQLAHALASGLNEFCRLPVPSPESVASVLDRGKRSMIGSYGFALGGLIVDKPATDKPAGLARRATVPSSWRVVLVLHNSSNKKFGVQEQSAFDNILSEQTNRSRRLEQLIANQMIPAAESDQFQIFCDSVHEYGQLSGEYYLGVQGGIYNGPVITSLVDTLLRCGAKGVGQSSWGPVVFCWCQNQAAATELLTRIQKRNGDSADAMIARPLNESASIQVARQS